MRRLWLNTMVDFGAIYCLIMELNGMRCLESLKLAEVIEVLLIVFYLSPLNLTVYCHYNNIRAFIVLYCIVLYCSVLYCIVLYCIVLYCIVLYCIVLYCIVLYCIVLYCIVLYCIVLYCIVLYCIVLYCIVCNLSCGIYI